MQKKQVTTALIILLVIGLVVGVIYYFATNNPQDAINISQPTPSNSPQSQNSTERVERSISNTPYVYTVNATLESKFTIHVTKPADSDNSLLLQITGKGCNMMNASVIDATVSQVEGALAETTIGGIRYQLTQPSTTLMACTGEAENYDAALISEIKSVFLSIQDRR